MGISSWQPSGLPAKSAGRRGSGIMSGTNFTCRSDSSQNTVEQDDIASTANAVEKSHGASKPIQESGTGLSIASSPLEPEFALGTSKCGESERDAKYVTASALYLRPRIHNHLNIQRAIGP
jgi:hypothetical protein